MKFKEQANDIDKKRMKMDILVTKIKDESSEVEKIISNDAIFPIFNENIIIDRLK